MTNSETVFGYRLSYDAGEVSQHEDHKADGPAIPNELLVPALTPDTLLPCEYIDPNFCLNWPLDVPPAVASALALNETYVSGDAGSSAGLTINPAGFLGNTFDDATQPSTEHFLRTQPYLNPPGFMHASPSIPPASAQFAQRAQAAPWSSPDTMSIDELDVLLEQMKHMVAPDTGTVGYVDHGQPSDCFYSCGYGYLRNIAPKPAFYQAAVALPASPQAAGSDNTQAPASKRKRKRFDDEKRTKVKTVRKLGACFRCRIYKLQCDEELPCGNCIKIKDKQRVYRGPCVRLNIGDVHTFRAGDGDNGTIRAVLPKYKWLLGGEMKTIKIQWPFQNNPTDSPVLVIECQQFVPEKQNLAEEYAIGGAVHKVEFPPWACFNAKASCKDVKDFVIDCQGRLEDEIRETLSDSILAVGWNEAVRYRAVHGSPLVARALQIYASATMNSRYPAAVEADAFGVADPVHTPYFFKKLPLPPQLTYQVQTMIALTMMEVQTELIKQLKTRIFAKDRVHHWYEVFLTIFVLLATIEKVYQIQIRFLHAKYGVSTRNFTNISYVTQHMLDEWESSAFNLIGHFRCVMNGEVPFSQSWEKDAENPKRTGLDSDALAFLRHLQEQIRGRKDELLAMRRVEGKLRFEQPLGAICELFLPAEQSSKDKHSHR